MPEVGLVQRLRDIGGAWNLYIVAMIPPLATGHLVLSSLVLVLACGVAAEGLLVRKMARHLIGATITLWLALALLFSLGWGETGPALWLAAPPVLGLVWLFERRPVDHLGPRWWLCFPSWGSSLPAQATFLLPIELDFQA